MMKTKLNSLFNTISNLPFALSGLTLLSGALTVTLVLHLDSSIKLLPGIAA